MAAEEQFVTRRFGASRAAFIVRCPSQDVADCVESLFADLPDAPEAAQWSEFELAEGSGGRLELFLDGERRSALQRRDGALASLITSVSRLALDCDPKRLHLHGAGLSNGGVGVVISAASGTGKTTLSTALALKGWSYVTDEALALSGDGATIRGFAKPLMIKPSGVHLFPRLRSARVTLEPESDLWWLVPVTRIPSPPTPEMAPRVIVLLERPLDGSFEVRPQAVQVHPADAVVALMGQTMDAARFGRDAVGVLANLAARCRSVSVQVGQLDQMVELVEGQLEFPAEPVVVQALQQSPEGRAPGWTSNSGVTSVAIDDRVVVHDSESGRIAAFDVTGSGVWMAVLGLPPTWWNPAILEAPGAVHFLETLESHGFCSRARVGGQ